MAATAENSPGNWGLIAGNGDFPFLVLEGARSRGIEMAVIAIREEASPALEKCRETISLGEPRRTRPRDRFAASRGSETRGDGRAGETQQNFQLDPAGLASRETAFCAPGEKHGFTDWSSCSRAAGRRNRACGFDEVSRRAAAGRRSAHAARAGRSRSSRTLEYGRQVAGQIAGHDLGQTVVIRDRACVAIEAMEGTDETIERAARIAGGQRLVVVKVSKPQQDMRFDVPVVGLKTIEVMRRANATALGINAGRTLLFQRDELIRAADDAGIAIQAFAPEPASAKKTS